MKTINTRKVDALPTTLEASTLYLVKDAADASLFDLHVSDSTGSATRHVINKVDVQGLINTALTGLSGTKVVADIAARDALAPTTVTYALVLSAVGDATVTSGAATYVFDPATTTWTKVSEAESMDIVFNWALLQDKPVSLVADIDDAVAKRHAHANLAVLDTINVNAGGQLTVSSVAVAGGWLLEETW